MKEIFTRDHAIWLVTFISGVLTFLVASTTSLIPAEYVDKVRDIAAVLGFIGGAFGMSPLKLSDDNPKKQEPGQ